MVYIIQATHTDQHDLAWKSLSANLSMCFCNQGSGSGLFVLFCFFEKKKTPTFIYLFLQVLHNTQLVYFFKV